MTQSGIEFVSTPFPPVPLTDVALSRHDAAQSPTRQFRSWEEEVRELSSPTAVRSARYQQRRVTFQQPLEEQYSADEKWLLSLQTSSSMESADPPETETQPPPGGDQIVEQPPLGLRPKWLPVENFYPYE